MLLILTIWFKKRMSTTQCTYSMLEIYNIHAQLHGSHFYQLTGFSPIILECTVVCTLSLLDIKVFICEHNKVH